jgi:uncharacterized protein YbjT (DUF2867 family)
MNDNKYVLIFGATGNIGGALTRELLRRGWQVQADMDDPASLEVAFDGMERVFSVQSWWESGVEVEERQGKLVADVAREVGVKHLVYGSAGIGVSGTGIPHFENKIVVKRYMLELGLPVTVLRPTPFMELMTQKDFYPALATWGTMPRIVPWEMPYPWVAVEDIGIALANIFSNPDRWIGQDIDLCGDVQSLEACRAIFRQVTDKKPFRIPFPVILFEKMVGKEMVDMWRWAVDWIEEEGRDGLWAMVESSRQLHPGIKSVETWLRQSLNGHSQV